MKTFNKTSFKRWLEAQSPARRFDYLNNRRCVAASFLKEELKSGPVYVGAFAFKFGSAPHGSIHDLDQRLPEWFVNLIARTGTYPLTVEKLRQNL